jgi:DNA-binding NarL/FixJ family response regulator
MIKVYIIDDHPLVIDGIKTMLKEVDYVSIVGQAKNSSEAMRALADPDANLIDVILLDINLPDIDGLRLCTLIRERNKNVKIIGLTYVNEAGIISQLIKKGGNGYLLKTMEREELLEAINQVMDGNIFLSRQANEKMLQQLQAYDISDNKIPSLTRREKEILKLLSEGLTSHEIASHLFLSSYTIDTHRKNMLQKFNVHNTQALLKAVNEFKILD